MEVWLRVQINGTDENGEDVDIDDHRDAVARDLAYEVGQISDSLEQVSCPVRCDCDRCDGEYEDVQPEVTDVDHYTYDQMRERFRPVSIIR